MPIVLLAAGTRGDVQPYVALGAALRNAGQRVRVATFAAFRALVEDAGLEHYPLLGDVVGIAGSDAIRHAIEADNPLKVLLSFNQLGRLAAGLNAGFVAACADATAVVYHPGAAIGRFIAADRGLPGILATPFPMTRTGAYPALVFYAGPRLGRAYNQLTHRAFEAIMWTAAGGSVRAYWRKAFGRDPDAFGNPFGRAPTPTTPTLVGCSRHVFPHPGDWPAHVHQTGYWFLDEPAWTPPSELSAFLESGPAPVYVGFGSIGTASQAEATTRLVVEACQRAGQRAVLATGWHGMSGSFALPPGMLRIESAPHAWLFPRMAAVVHHGGAGTTAAGLRAGVPTLVIPHGNDQFAWGRRIFELGAGPRPIPRRRLTAINLADALTALRAPELRAAAAELGQRIRAEDGLTKAARIILGTLS
ncbi:MAG TPA: glycosyltransferase [Anaerolineales bacterium]|nr:glycosyltransferase [Anaerolineales bacterium]